MTRFPQVFFLFFLLCLVPRAYSLEKELRYTPKGIVTLAPPEISDSDWRWLGQKRDVVLGVYGSVRPPFVRIDPDGKLSGFMPDSIFTALRSLDLNLSFKHYTTADAAYAAMDKGELDFVFSAAGDVPPVPTKKEDEVLLARAKPVLIVRQTNDDKSRNISPSSSLLKGISHLTTSPGVQLSLVAHGYEPYATLPAGEAYYLIERNYVNTLLMKHILPDGMTPYRFIVRPDEPVLSRTLTQAIENLNNDSKGKIISARWDQNDLISFIDSPLNLTPAEKDWLKNHQNINVAASDFSAPFFLKDGDNQNAGITPELLALIELKTGLSFHFTELSDSRDISAHLEKRDVLMTAALIWSRQRSREFLLTTPFMYTPEVLIRAKSAGASTPIHSAALVPDQDATLWFRQAYPDAHITFVGNSSLAMQWVVEGRVDATINTLLSARYLMKGLYPGKLQLARSIPVSDAAITFAIRRNEPELHSIMNKTLAVIPPGMTTRILTRWQGTPAAHFNTWKVYRNEFYIGAAAALVVILSTLMWAVLLRKQVWQTRRNKSLLRQEIMFRDKLINGPPRPVYVATPEGEIIHTNKAFQVYFDETVRPLLSLSLYDSRHPLFAIWQECIQHPLDGSAATEAEYAILNGKERRHIRHWVTAYTGDGQRTGGMICGWQDVTDYLRLLEELSLARETAEQASQSKSRFLATMSHEIRTPLSAVIGLLELQTRERQNDTKLIEVAHESAVSLLAILGDILDMAKIESGKMLLHPEWTALHGLVRPVVRAFEDLALQKGIKLLLKLPEQDCQILVDGSRLRQILSNLISNAVKFTERGEIRVSVDVLINGHTVNLHLIVTDTGLGITADQQKNLFKPFEQAAPSTKGTGLGLSICREIAQLMGGNIMLESMPDVGTTLRVVLPVTTRSLPQQICEDPAFLAPSSKKLNVLIVDDHPANRLLLRRQLKLLGHNSIDAENGLEGLNRWRDERPDVVITDCSMPVMGGPEMTQQIREENGAVFIIGITANAQQSERQRCLNAGMNECLFRPVELAHLSSVLNKAPETGTSKPDVISDWINMAAVERFLPESPDTVHEFISTVLTETGKDLAQAHQSLEDNNYKAAARLFHRIAGTLRVIGVYRLTDKCELLEELIELEEEKGIVLQHLDEAKSMLHQFSSAFLDSNNNF